MLKIFNVWWIKNNKIVSMFPHTATSNYISNSFPINTNEKWNNTVFIVETPLLIFNNLQLFASGSVITGEYSP
jgi:hypothetical protein